MLVRKGKRQLLLFIPLRTEISGGVVALALTSDCMASRVAKGGAARPPRHALGTDTAENKEVEVQGMCANLASAPEEKSA